MSPTLIYSHFSWIIPLGVGAGVLFIGWRVGIQSQLKDLIDVLKTRNEVLEHALAEEKEKARDLEALLLYEREKSGHVVNSLHEVNTELARQVYSPDVYFESTNGSRKLT